MDETGRTTSLHANMWSQSSTAEACPTNDFDCYTAQLQAMTGSWRWEVLDAASGATTFVQTDAYVWDLFQEPGTGEWWALWSQATDRFNLGTVSWDDTGPALRDDLALSRVDPTTGALSETVALGLTAKPLLLYGWWQALAGTHTANTNPLRLAVVPDGEGAAVVLRTAEGYAAVGRTEGGDWGVVAETDASGAVR